MQGAQSTWEKVPAPVVHVQPGYTQHHTVQVMQQDYISQCAVLLSSASAGPCTLSAQHHGCKLQQPLSSCEQGLVRSLLCRHVAAPLLVPSPALQLQGQCGAVCSGRAANICCVINFLRAESAQHLAAFAHCLLLASVDASHAWVLVL